jgi:hypothetical protein
MKSSIRKSLRSICLSVVAIIVLCLLTVDCATSGFTGFQTVGKPARRVGMVSDSLISYSSLEGKHFPTATSPYLEVVLKKKLAAKVRYDSTTYQETIFKKQRSKIEGNILPLACIAGLSLLLGEPYSDYYLGATGLVLLLTPSPPAEYSYTHVPGSDNVIVSYRDEVVNVPAPGEVLIAFGRDTVQTDESGVAQFHVDPSQCDVGVTIEHPTTGESYIVRRVLKDNKITADWTKTVKLLRKFVGTTVTVAELAHLLTAGASAELVILTVIVDAITGVVIDFFIEKLGASTQHYYDWLIVVRR